MREEIKKTKIYPPLKEAEDESSEWQELPPNLNVYHDNNRGKPERKFIHPDGREVVYDGDTGKKISDPKLKGTYNFVNPGSPPTEIWDVWGWTKWVTKGVGHIGADVISYKMGGNVRGHD